MRRPLLLDRLHDGDPPIGATSLGAVHKAGVKRGLVFMMAVAIPFALAFASGHRDSTDSTSDSLPIVSAR